MGAPSWRQYGARAVDGLVWSLTASDDISIDAGGANAYPPAGEGGESAAFDRLLLAVARLVGRELWPGAKTYGIADILDGREQAEHLMLAACRAWAAELDRGVAARRRLPSQSGHGTVGHVPTDTAGRPGKASGRSEWG